MTLKEDLENEVKKIFSTVWDTRKGNVVPHDTSVGLGNDGIELTATVLYADLASSTALVDSETASFAAEIYKSYLFCSGKIIRSHQGEITAYDGDRIMAVFIGDKKNTRAVKTGLKINYAVTNIINPAIKRVYGDDAYSVKHVVGIDTSELLVAKTGVRGANDLVWVGRAANYAAKLSSLNTYKTYITYSIYDNIESEVKVGGKDDKNMWTALDWNAMDKMRIYGSNWTWAI